ncbi:MAG: multicopper oxidase domain-containing protein, partial [Myxococcales bacterium]
AKNKLSRRDMLKITAAGGAATMIAGKASALCPATDTVPVDIVTASNTLCPVDADLFPTSPFITTPFVDPLPVPQALRPGFRDPGGALSPNPNAWNVRQKGGVFGNFTSVPGPGPGNQDSIGDRPMYNDGKLFTFFNPKTGASTTKTMNFGGARAGGHQLWAGGAGSSYQYLRDGMPLSDGTPGKAKSVFDAMNPNVLMYHIRLTVAEHGFTSSNVQPIDSAGKLLPGLPLGATAPAGTVAGTFKLPKSTIYGFNGTFPGPMINASYGSPVVVRFENDLDLNPSCLNRQDFGAPDWAFLTHLHNGHTAPESDGQPNHLQDNDGGYLPGQWSDNSYLLYAAGGDDAEKQSFLWFHDHRMHHTGPNVYKGMVGLAPHYDAKIDNGDETRGLRLPGVRTNNLDAAGNYDGTFNVKYDIPMALYDFRADDGMTPHADQHTPVTPDPRIPGLVCGDVHPEWWGKLFHRHYPNHGFVGDIFTVNGVAMPVLHVEKRKYRFRFLGASLSRQYKLSLQTGTPMPFPGMQGQWNLGKISSGKQVPTAGTQMFRWTQIASEGGLLPTAIPQDVIEIWPAKRREVIVDFSKDLNGRPVASGTVVYLVNVAKMLDGRMQSSLDPNYCVPMVKIVIGDPAKDDSLMPATNQILRPCPDYRVEGVAPGRDFTLERGGLGGETEWIINGAQFDPQRPLATPLIGSAETWGINNGGGGWTHPMHLHMEEHHVTFRSSKKGKYPDEAGDTGKDDVVSLTPSEQTRVFRRFRTFLGNYVAHCHNLAHEDHNMMFGWTIRKT